MPNRKNGKVSKKSKGKAKMLNYGPSLPVQQRALLVTFPWQWSATLAEVATGGTGAFYTLAVNNAYDPNFTGVGLQPLGFDQYSALYSRYRVIRVRYEIDVANRGANPLRYGCYPSPQSTLPADPNAWTIQNAATQVKLMSASTGGMAVGRLSGSIDLPKLFGLTKSEFLNEHDFSAIISAGPARVGYLQFFITGLTATVADVNYTVRLYMTTELSAPVALGLS